MRHVTWFRHPAGGWGLLTCLLILLCGGLLHSGVQAQTGTWLQKTTVPTGRGAVSASAVDGKIYVMGGVTPATWVPQAANEVYDPALNTWEKKEPLPTPRGFLSSAVVNGIIYAIGGGYPTATSVMEAYDPATNTWAQKQNMLSPRAGAQAGVVNGIIYNVGGNASERNCEAYDPVTDRWTQKTPRPESGGDLAVTVYNGLVYTFGGGIFGTAHRNVYAYDPQTDTWTKRADMPTARYGFQTYLVGGKIYAVGGSPASGGALKTVEVYDPVSDTWETQGDMPEALAWFGGAVVNDRIYVISGTADGGMSGTGAVWEYDPNATISVTPQVVDFGHVLVGESSDTVEVEVRNVGLHTLTVNSITLDGTTFSLSNVPSLPAPLAPTDSLVFGVFFNPAMHGDADAQVVVGTGDGLQPTARVGLKGCGLQYGPELRQLVDRVNSASYPNRPAIVDSFFTEHPVMPLIERDSICQFLYRGNATTVCMAGDANGWLTGGSPLTRLSTTDLWIYADVYEPDARLDYKFIENGTNWILDPRNPLTCAGPYGPNSEVAMPSYSRAPELLYYPDIPHGVLHDTTFHSSILGNTRTIRVYTPPGYSQAGTDSFEVAVLHDGEDWVSIAKANNALDYLIYHGRVRPLIAVFVPPVNRDPEYVGAQQDQFAAFISTELMPYIDARHRTEQRPMSRASMGISAGGNIALWIMAKYPQEFGNAASYSGSVLGATTSVFDAAPAHSCKVYLDAGTYDITGFLAMSRNLRDIMQARGYDYRYNEWHEGHSWGSWGAHLDNALEFFFPGSAVGMQEEHPTPTAFTLYQNYPNPFNPSTTIRYELPSASLVRLSVYDILGRVVSVLVVERKGAGSYEVKFDAGGLASGLYVYRLQAGDFVQTRKLLFLQ